MCFYESLHSLGKQLDVNILWETGYYRGIIYGRLGVLNRIHIYAHLCIRQWDIAHIGMFHFGSLLLNIVSTHHMC